MLILNRHPDKGTPLAAADRAALGPEGAAEVTRYLAIRPEHAPTPLVALPGLAQELGLGTLHIKDEGQRLGLGSFKALGGAYAVVRLVLEEAGRRLGRTVALADVQTADVRRIAAEMTFACATDGNHGRSVAQGAQLVGARSVIFVHAKVTPERIAAIARFGARMVVVDGTYDDSVTEAARVAEREGWTTVSDTSWEGYERIPRLVMQGYTALVAEALVQLPALPTHVFVQCGVGGIAAAAAAHLALRLGQDRPFFTVVEPDRSACMLATAQAGRPTKIPAGAPTVMAMLECYEPSPIAWDVLKRVADAFMDVPDETAVEAMNRLARPPAGDRAIVAGESGAAGCAGLLTVLRDPGMSRSIGLGPASRVLLVNTEGATDPGRYRELTGLDPSQVAARAIG